MWKHRVSKGGCDSEIPGSKGGVVIGKCLGAEKFRGFSDLAAIGSGFGAPAMFAALVLVKFPFVFCGIAIGVGFAILAGLVAFRRRANNLAIAGRAAPAKFAALVLVNFECVACHG